MQRWRLAIVLKNVWLGALQAWQCLTMLVGSMIATVWGDFLRETMTLLGRVPTSSTMKRHGWNREPSLTNRLPTMSYTHSKQSPWQEITANPNATIFASQKKPVALHSLTICPLKILGLAHAILDLDFGSSQAPHEVLPTWTGKGTGGQLPALTCKAFWYGHG